MHLPSWQQPAAAAAAVIMVKINVSCNSTLEELRISSGSEVTIVGRLNFHDLARIVAAGCTLIAVVLSLYLVSQHARNYTKPREQRQYVHILLPIIQHR